MIACLVGLGIVDCSAGNAEDPPAPPEVKMCLPLGALAEQTTAIRARGLQLEGVTDVRSTTAGVEVKFLKASKADLPGGLSAERAGDTQVEFELTVGADWRPEEFQEVELVFVAPQGEATYRLPLNAANDTVLEREPNPGYQQSQPMELSQVVLGQIEQPRDVDVYALDLTADQPVRIRVVAQALGSALDPLLSLVDDSGTTLETNDDHADSRDAQLEVIAPFSGRFYVVVQDANDQGGGAQPYRLMAEQLPPPVSFVRDIAPLLQRRCVACHGPRKREGGYRVDTFEYLTAMGDSGAQGFVAHSLDDSESYRRMTSEDETERMPLNGEAFSAEELTLVERWLMAGGDFDGGDRAAPLLSQIPPIEHAAAPEEYVAPVPISAIAFSPTGNELFVGGYREIIVMNPETGVISRRIGNVPERVHQIAMHPSAERLAVAGGNPGQLGEVRLFSLSGELQQVLATQSDVIHDVAFNPAGDRLAVAGSDTVVRIYELATGALELEIASHLDWVLAVAWSPDGKQLASASRDKTAKVTSVQDGRLISSYSRHDAAVRGITFHPSGTEVYTSGANQRWDRWEIQEGKHVRDMGLGGEAYKLSAIGEYFLVPSSNNTVHLMKAQESERLHELRGSESSRFLSAAAHPATDRVAAGTDRGEIELWELSTGKHLANFPGYPVPSPPTP